MNDVWVPFGSLVDPYEEGTASLIEPRTIGRCPRVGLNNLIQSRVAGLVDFSISARLPFPGWPCMVIALLGGLNAAERYDSLIEVSDPPGEKSFLRRNIVASHRLQIIGNEVFKLLFIANTVGVSIGWIRFSEAGYGRICRGFAVLVLIILGQLRLLVITRGELIRSEAH